MKGRNHELISLGLALPVYVTLWMTGAVDDIYQVLFIVGVAIGSLVPDVDASDARIMHGHYGYVGQFFKYIIYGPIAYLTGERGHRQIMHRLKGMVMTIALLTVVFIVLIVAYWYLAGRGISLALIFIIIAFLIGLSTGYCLHLFEDMHTMSGIQWTESGMTIRGPIRTGSKQEDYVAGAYMIWGVICTYFVYKEMYLVAFGGLLLGILIVMAVVFLLLGRL